MILYGVFPAPFRGFFFHATDCTSGINSLSIECGCWELWNILTAPQLGQAIFPLNATEDTVSCLWQAIQLEIHPELNLITASFSLFWVHY